MTKRVTLIVSLGLAACSISALADDGRKRSSESRSEVGSREDASAASDTSRQAETSNEASGKGGVKRPLSREEREQLRRDVEEYGREVYRDRNDAKSPRGKSNR